MRNPSRTWPFFLYNRKKKRSLGVTFFDTRLSKVTLLCLVVSTLQSNYKPVCEPMLAVAIHTTLSSAFYVNLHNRSFFIARHASFEVSCQLYMMGLPLKETVPGEDNEAINACKSKLLVQSLPMSS